MGTCVIPKPWRNGSRNKKLRRVILVCKWEKNSHYSIVCGKGIEENIRSLPVCQWHFPAKLPIVRSVSSINSSLLSSLVLFIKNYQEIKKFTIQKKKIFLTRYNHSFHSLLRKFNPVFGTSLLFNISAVFFEYNAEKLQLFINTKS